MKLQYCVWAILLPLLHLKSQPFTLTGTVTGPGNAPVVGAALYLVHCHASAETRQDGRFSIALRAESDTLVIAHISYQSQRVVVHSGSPPLFIHLEEAINGMQEVTVSTGYQSVPKERSTGSFAFVDSTLFNRRVSTDVIGRLEGVVPGLLFNRNTVNNASGLMDISIRGHSTLYANDQPLVVVDGFPYDGDIGNLNPNDVESITVLKDAAASSIWGVRSGNGVIVITTKKGRQGQKLTVEFNTNLTVGEKPNLRYNPDFLPSNDFINIEQDLFNRGYYDDDLTSSYHVPVSPVVQILSDERTGLTTATDATTRINALRGLDVRNHLSRYFYRPSFNQQYSVGLRGGGMLSDYYFSLGYDAGQANQVGNSNSRLTTNAEYRFYPVKNLVFSASLHYIASVGLNNSPLANINTTGKGTIYPYARLTGPIVKDYAMGWTDTAGGVQLLGWDYRPLDELHNADNETRTMENRLDLGLQYRFLRHISSELRYQYEKASSSVNNYYSDSTYYARNLINQYTQLNPGGSRSYPIPVGGILQQAAGTLSSHHLRGQLDYNNTFRGKHALAAIAGAEINETINSTSGNTVYGYDKSTGGSISNIDYLDYFNLDPSGGASQVPTTLGFGQTTDHYISYFGNAAYTYNNLYTISASGRVDKSNLFGVSTNQKAVPLYSTGLAWDLSREKFYHLAWLPYLKLRATYGYNGNVNKNATAVTTIQLAGNSYYYGTPNASIANPGNPELQWEKIRMVNVGVDFGLRGQAVSGSIEYYTKKGINLFGNAPLPPSTGLASFFGNTAATTGRGLDLVLNTRNITQKHFSWQTNFLLSYALDKLSRYDLQVTSDQYIGYANASAIIPLNGRPVYAVYSYRWAGLDPSTGDPQGYLGKTVSKDYGTILSSTSLGSMVYNGPARPTVFGSLRNSFTFRKFSFSFNIVYKLGYRFRRDSYLSSGLPWSGNRDYYRRWRQPGDEKHTYVPSPQYPPYDNYRDQFYQYSSVLVDKGDHIRLQDISLGYSVGKNWRLYGYANNVGILWRANRDGLDPDLASAGGMGVYASPRTYAIGIQASF